MKIKIRFAVALFVVVVSGCTSLETVFIPGDSSDWKLGSGSNRKGQTFVEYVPRNESINNWSRLLTIQFLEGDPSTPLSSMEAVRSRMQARCPGVSWNIIHQDASSVLYEWKISGCAGNPDQHEIARLLRGNDGIHRIAYVEKTSSIPSAQRERWVKAFLNAYVEKDGQRVTLAR